MNKNIRFVAAALLAGVTAIGLFIAFNLMAPRGELEVTTTPSGALVKVNSKNYKSPVKVKLKEGIYYMEAKLDGYYPGQAEAKVKKNKKTSITISLEKNFVNSELEKTVAGLSLLPQENEKYRILWVSSSETIKIVPKIPFGPDKNPQEALNENWSTYESSGKEALQWLENNKLGKKIREENKINLEWWGEEWWPEGKSIE